MREATGPSVTPCLLYVLSLCSHLVSMLCLLNLAESIFCILHLVKFNEGSCADLGSVGTSLSVFRLPGSTTSIVPAAFKEDGSVVT